MTATIWRTCPSCYASFEQPDDPGRKRVYCSRACQQAAYRARQRHNGGGPRHSSGQQRAGRQDRRLDWRSESHGQRRQRADPSRPALISARTGAGERQNQQHTSSAGRRPAAPTVTGPAPSGDELARISRIIAALLRKAAATSLPARGRRLPRQGRNMDRRRVLG
jgi:hypothetical protein